MLLLFRSPFAVRHSPGVSQPFLNHRHQGGVDELLHEFGAGVVRAGGLAFGALGEPESELAFGVEDGLEVEEGFIHAAQLFHVQGPVVHAPPDLFVLGREV